MTSISIQTLETVFSRILEKLRFDGVQIIHTDMDLYNEIPTHDWDITKKVEDVVIIGSLADDIESLHKLAADVDRPCTYVDFDRFASVLRAISEIRNPVNG